MSELLDLLAVAPEGTEKVLQAFALAEALTDPIAERIYEIVSLEGISFAEFRSAISYSNVIDPRNSEWSVTRSARAELVERASLDPKQADAVHEALLAAAAEGDPEKAGWETPHYLFTHAGLAFHNAALRKVEVALQHYSESAIGAYGGNQWLATNFAIQQEKSGLLPPGAIETLFLRAIVLFRTGNRPAALPLFGRIARSERVQREVAIALHIVANDDSRRGRFEVAEAGYKRSIEIGQAIGNEHHVAQTEHSLANMYAKQAQFDDAEAAYKRSMEMLSEIEDLFGLAQTNHSLANMYAKQGRSDEAEAAYKRSIAIDAELNNQSGVAQTEHSLANMYSKQGRFDEAEAAYKRSIAIDAVINNQLGLAKAEHSLANMYAKQGRIDEADSMYSKSIEALRRIGDRRGIAMVLLSFGLMLRWLTPDRALNYFEEALKIDHEIGNVRGENIIRETISQLKNIIDRDKAK